VLTTPTPKALATNNSSNSSLKSATIKRRRERALLVQLRLSGRIEQEELDELRLLAESAGAEVCGAITGSRQVPDAATFIGKGKAEEVDAVVREHADLVLVNHELSPAQERNPKRSPAAAC
jgi:GTP-binding protein HflX